MNRFPPYLFLFSAECSSRKKCHPVHTLIRDLHCLGNWQWCRVFLIFQSNSLKPILEQLGDSHWDKSCYFSIMMEVSLKKMGTAERWKDWRRLWIADWHMISEDSLASWKEIWLLPQWYETEVDWWELLRNFVCLFKTSRKALNSSIRDASLSEFTRFWLETCDGVQAQLQGTCWIDLNLWVVLEFSFGISDSLMDIIHGLLVQFEGSSWKPWSWSSAGWIFVHLNFWLR